MSIPLHLALATAVCLALCAVLADKTPGGSARSIYDFTVKDIDGKEVKLSRYQGDVLLIVNVASR